MLDIKEWLQTTGMSVAEDCFKSPPALPYAIFSEESNIRGADTKKCLVDRSVTIEMYSNIINREKEKVIQNLLDEKSINYKKHRTWIDSEKFFQTVYDFDFTEKI